MPVINAKEKLKEEKAKLKLSQDDNDPKFPGVKTWLREIDTCHDVIMKGLDLGWGYGKETIRYRKKK